MQRRELFPILGLAVVEARALLAQHVHGATPDFSAYQPRALAAQEYALLDQITALLLPADETGPGAREAHVPYFLDTVLHYRSPEARHAWKQGLAAVNELAVESYSDDFIDCSPEQQHAVLTKLAENESAPATVAERFFREWKRASIDAFYFSEQVQREHLGYRGHTAIAEFRGCPHDHAAEG